MSTIYSIIPFSTLDDKERADMRKYLAEHGLEYPLDAHRSCYPTENEIETVFLSFDSCEVEFHLDTTANREKPCTQVSLIKRVRGNNGSTFAEYVTLNVVGTLPDKNSPCRFYLSGGSESLNYAFLEQLAYLCGPLFCITDGECDAVIFHRKQLNTTPGPSFAIDHHSYRRSR
jgi:hypothetical protein